MTKHPKRILNRPTLVALAVTAALASNVASAFEFDTGDSGWKTRWDNTIKYSTIYRLHDADAAQLGSFIGSGSGDGDYNFKKGIVSNRIDWLTEFDAVQDSSRGIRISASGWYDTVYHRSNDNPGLVSPAGSLSSHNVTTASNQFSSDTKRDVGADVRLLDAFAFVKTDIAEKPLNLRLGRHTVIYGETLMSGANGIAAAQGAVDIVKAATVPGAQVKEFLLPTNQVSATFQPTDKVSLGAYYQFEWQKSYFFPAGSFLSPNDVTGNGAESLLQPGAATLPPTADMKARNSGQWGAQVRFKPEGTDMELGLYGANYHDKVASALVINAATGTYTRVYQEDIKTFGASLSTVVADDNVSLEVSRRGNVPLTGGLCPGGPAAPAAYPLGCGYVVTALPTQSYDNKGNSPYAVGTTQHATAVDIHIFQPNMIMRDGGSVAIQYDWHEVVGVDRNADKIDPTTTVAASTITVAFSADWFNAFSNIDLAFPLVYSHNLSGRSRAYVGWIENGGSVDVGVTAKYLTYWKAGLNFHHFIGNHGTGVGWGNFDQTQWDRDYASFNISTSF